MRIVAGITVAIGRFCAETTTAATTTSSNGGSGGGTNGGAGGNTTGDGSGGGTTDGNGGTGGNTTADGQNGNGTGGMSIFLILTIIFSVLIGLGLIWICLLAAWLLEWYPAYEERERRKREMEEQPPIRYPVRGQRPFPPYSASPPGNPLPYY